MQYKQSLGQTIENKEIQTRLEKIFILLLANELERIISNCFRFAQIVHCSI